MGRVTNYLRSAAFSFLFGKDGMRSYNAGQLNRFTTGKIFSGTSINQDVRAGLRSIRNRVRNTVQNDGYAKAYLNRWRVNGVGPEGPSLQNRAKLADGSIDKVSNDIIETAWEKWCRKDFCTMAGMLSFVQVLWLFSDYMKRDGEFICRKVTGPKVNKFGFSLQLLDPEDLEEHFTKQMDNGNVVYMGIEYNEWRRPVAFWMRQKNLMSDLFGAHQTQLVRVPAEEIIFVHDPEFSKQIRAVSPMAQVLINMNMTTQWEEASLINASATAQTMGFLTRKSTAGGTAVLGDGTLNRMVPGGDKAEPTGDSVMEFNPGMIVNIPLGYEYALSDPKFPHEQHGPFLKSMLRRIASALGLSYNSWANDYEGVNYSSLRASLLDERDYFQQFQTMMREQFLLPVFEEWLKYAMLTGAVNIGYMEYERVCRPIFMGRRWQWVDPEKEVNASLMAINGGLSSHQKELAKQGEDVYETFEQLHVEKELAKDLNLNFNNGAGNASKGNTGAVSTVTE